MVSETLSAFIVRCNLYIMEFYKEEYLNGKLKCSSEPNVYFQSFLYLYMWLLRCPFYGREQPFYLAQPQISTKFDEIFNRDSQTMIFCSNGKLVLKVKNDCWWRHHKLKNCFFMSFLSRQPVAFGVLLPWRFFFFQDLIFTLTYSLQG